MEDAKVNRFTQKKKEIPTLFFPSILITILDLVNHLLY